MKINFFLPGPILILFCFSGFGQVKQFAYYFDSNLNPAKQSNSVFTGNGTYQADGLFEFRLYNSSTKRLILIEHYTDSSLRVNEGSSESFYADNITESKSNYANGTPDGLWLKWDSAGRVIDSTIYKNGKQITETSLGYHENGALDSLVKINFTSDTYEKKYYDDSARLRSDVSFTGQKGFLEYYDKGILTSGDSVFSRLEIEAEFPGGTSAWNKYVESHLQKKINKIIKSGNYGTCWVKFIVGKDGTVRSAQATTMNGTVLADEAIKIIMDGPKWLPASQYGRPVNAYRLQPVTITPN